MKEKKYTLSICLVTMNRAQQLCEALKSCLACQLPKETEFIIVDNASTDHTEEVVKTTLQESGYAYYYEKLPENLGVGGGRNYAYGKAKGDAVYMMDDDAVIDFERNPDFFLHALSLMKQYDDIATLTTQIYDIVWEDNRVQNKGPAIAEGLYSCQMFCGGSHFLKKKVFPNMPYLNNRYGYEELPPSLRAVDLGKQNAFCPALLVIHKPAINKWDWTDEKNCELLVKGFATSYAIKRMMYPFVFAPVLRLATWRRIKKYGTQISNAEKRVWTMAKTICRENPIEGKIKFSTVCRLIKDFKLSAF